MRKLSATFIQLVWLVSLNQCFIMYPTTFHVIKQFEECRLLKMIKEDDNIYYPNEQESHNELDDKHYQNLSLIKKTFDEAMDFYKSMFANLAVDCKSKLCKCAKSIFVEQDLSTYNVLFSTESNFAHTKRIVSSFLNKYKPELLSIKIIKQTFPAKFADKQESIMPTLMEFFVNFDFTLSRLLFYNLSINCQAELVENYDSCVIPIEMANRTVISKPLNSALAEQLLICDLMAVANTCDIEYQRFFAMNTFAIKYSQIKFSSGNLTWNLDRLLKASSRFDPSINFDSAKLELIEPDELVFNIFTAYYKDEELKIDKIFFPPNFKSILFKSNLLQIDVRKTKSDDELSYFSSVNISLLESFNSIKPMHFLTIDNPKSQIKSLNKNIIKNKDGLKIAQIISKESNYMLDDGDLASHATINIYDFNSNSKIVISINQHRHIDKIELITSVKNLDNATGLFIDGRIQKKVDATRN